MSQEFQPLFETTPYFNSQMLSNIPMTNGNTAGNGNGNTATTPLTGNNNPPNVNETIDLLSFPETSHLSDEIFFNNYQFNNQLGSDSTNNNAFLSQQQQEQQQFLYNQQSQLQPPPPPQQQDQRINQINSATSAHSFDNELASNISSNSLNTYFSNPHASSSTSSSSSSSSSSLSFSAGSTNNINNNIGNNNNNQATSKVPTTPQQFIHHGRQNSTTIPIDQLTLLSLRTPGTTKPVNNQLIPQNQFNNLQQPNFDSYSPTSQPPSQQQQQQQNQLSQGFQPVSSSNPALVNNISVDANTIAAAVAAATAATEDITVGPVLEEGTINPRQLFNNKLGTSMSSPSLSTLFVNNRAQQQQPQPQQQQLPPQQEQNIQSLPTSAIPPDQQSIQQLAMQQQQQQVPVNHKRSSSTPHFDFKINDDFTNSISSWFNNQNGLDPNQQIDEENNKLFVNPNGILKNHTNIKTRNHSYSSGVMHSSRGTSRRNSVQLLSNGNIIGSNGGNVNGGGVILTTATAATANGLTTNSLHGSPITLTTAHFENINEENDSINDSSIDITNNPTGITTKPITTSVDEDGDAKHSRKRRKSSSAINMGETIGPLSDSPSISPTNSNTNNDTIMATSTVATKNITKEELMKKKSHSKSASTNNTTTATKNERKKLTTAHNVSPNGNGNGNSQASFPCNECDKQFKRSEHLKRHQRSVHSNDRPFACKYCEKKFSRSDNLAQHLKTHIKTDANGNAMIVYGNPSNHGRKEKKKSV